MGREKIFSRERKKIEPMATLKKRKLTMGKKYLLVFKKYGKTFGTIHNELSPAESN